MHLNGGEKRNAFTSVSRRALLDFCMPKLVACRPRVWLANVGFNMGGTEGRTVAHNVTCHGQTAGNNRSFAAQRIEKSRKVAYNEVGPRIMSLDACIARRATSRAPDVGAYIAGG